MQKILARHEALYERSVKCCYQTTLKHVNEHCFVILFLKR